MSIPSFSFSTISRLHVEQQSGLRRSSAEGFAYGGRLHHLVSSFVTWFPASAVNPQVNTTTLMKALASIFPVRHLPPPSCPVRSLPRARGTVYIKCITYVCMYNNSFLSYLGTVGWSSWFGQCCGYGTVARETGTALVGR